MPSVRLPLTWLVTILFHKCNKQVLLLPGVLSQKLVHIPIAIALYFSWDVLLIEIEEPIPSCPRRQRWCHSGLLVIFHDCLVIALGGYYR